MEIIQKIVVGGAVFNKDGKLLVLQRAADEEAYPNVWGLPGGSREPLETCEATLVRELKEEAGVDVLPLEAFSVFNYVVEKPGHLRDTTQIAFITQLLSPEQISLSSEHQAYAWISETELDNYDFSKETRKTVEAAFKRVASPVIS